MNRRVILLPLSSWLGTSLATAWFVGVSLADGGLAFPPLSAPGLVQWIERTDPVMVLFTTIRGGALLLALWTAVSVILSIGAIYLRSNALYALISRVGAPVVRRVVVRAVGLSLTGALAAPGSAIAVPQEPATEVTVGVPTLRHITSEDRASDRSAELSPAMTSPTAPDEPSPAPISPSTTAPSTNRTLVVEAGENFWTIASDILAERHQRQPNEVELVEYWQQLVTTNRHLLTNPRNPDLLFVGQRIEIPT